MNIPIFFYTLNVLGSVYFTPEFTNSIGSLIDWVSITSGAAVDIYFD